MCDAKRASKFTLDISSLASLDEQTLRETHRGDISRDTRGNIWVAVIRFVPKRASSKSRTFDPSLGFPQFSKLPHLYSTYPPIVTSYLMD